jgi:hypothetical protein
VWPSPIATLDDAHVLAGFAHLASAIGDGHTMIGVWGRTGYYPLRLAWFDDGVFVIGASDASLVGQRVVAIGKPIDDAVNAMTQVVSFDNTEALHDRLPDLLVDATLVAGVGLDPVYKLADGRTLSAPAATAHAPAIAPPKKLPVSLHGPSMYYWNRYEDGMLYFEYDKCAEDPRAGPIAKLIAGTLEFADQHDVRRFVIDLRRNDGGDSKLIQPLIDGLVARPKLAAYAIVGPHTFSSAVLAAMDLKRRAHATLVGAPTGGKPNSYGEIQMFELPHSHLKVQYSTKLFSFPDFPGNAVAPDIVVPNRSAAWFDGTDAALEAIARDGASPAIEK